MSKTESKKEEGKEGGKDGGIVNQPGVREMALFLQRVLSTLIRQFMTADASSSRASQTRFYPLRAHAHTLTL